MRSKDILKMLNDEVEELTDNISIDNITNTPINVKREPKKVEKEKRPFVKTPAFKAMCACLVCVAIVVGIAVPVLVLNGGQAGTDPSDNVAPPMYLDNSESYLTLDINPSVDFVIDGEDKVVKVISKNNDGDVLLTNFESSLHGMPIDDAVDATLDQAVRLGFIDAKAKGVIKVKVASDSDAKAEKVLSTVKSSAEQYFKEKSILVAVGAKVLDKGELLKGSGKTSIEEYNKDSSEKDNFYYVNNVQGMDDAAIVEAFKRDFMGKYIGEAIEEIFEDMEDVMDIAKDICEKNDELKDYQLENLMIPTKNYYELLDSDILATDEELADMVAEIGELIDKYNEEIASDEEDDEDYVDMSDLFEPIDNIIDLDALLVRYKAYEVININDVVSNLSDKLKEDIKNLDSVLFAIDGMLDKIFGSANEITAKIKNVIDKKVAEVTSQSDKYYVICKQEIDKAYNDLIINNQYNTNDIDPELYDEMLEDLLDNVDFGWDD